MNTGIKKNPTNPENIKRWISSFKFFANSEASSSTMGE